MSGKVQMRLLDSDNDSPSLGMLQKQFWSSLRNLNAEIYPSINGGVQFSPERRMDVYRTNGRSAHVSVLIDAYPVCKAILGEDYFKQVAKLYYKQTPSQNSDMNEYGASFSGFIAQLHVDRKELCDFPYLGDLARLEWNYQQVYYTEDENVFDFQLFQKKCEQYGEEVVLELQPSVFLLSSSYPIYEIWCTHRHDEPCQTIHAIHGSQYLCAYKEKYQVVVEKIDACVYDLLINIKQSKTLSEIADYFQGRYNLNETIETVLKRQWLVG